MSTTFRGTNLKFPLNRWTAGSIDSQLAFIKTRSGSDWRDRQVRLKPSQRFAVGSRAVVTRAKVIRY